MATPADQRLLELCDKWLKSLELHLRYSSLDSDSYWKVQPWPEHQRPSRWIIDLAVQKAVALRSQVQERIKQGDTRFSDSLELMTFLANLIGSEHIERFIPLADPDNEVDLKQPPPAPAPAIPAPPASVPAPPASVRPPPASVPAPPAPACVPAAPRCGPRCHSRAVSSCAAAACGRSAAAGFAERERDARDASSPDQAEIRFGRHGDARDAGVRVDQAPPAAGEHPAGYAHGAQGGACKICTPALGQATW